MSRHLYTLISKRFLLNLCAVGIGVVVACLIVEIMLRIVGYENIIYLEVDQNMGRVGRPNVSGIQDIEGRSYVKLNSRGFHDIEHPLLKDTGRYRVAVVGDSFSAAVEVELENSYPYKLGRALETCAALKETPIEVVNLAVNGYNLHQIYLTIRDIAPQYSPDLILVALTPNPQWLEPGTPERQLSPVVHVAEDNSVSITRNFRKSITYRIKSSMPYRRFVWLVDRSRLLQYVLELQYRIRTSNESVATQIRPDDSDPNLESAWATTAELFRGITKLGIARHVPIVLMLTVPGEEIDPTHGRASAPRANEDRYQSIASQANLPTLNISTSLQMYALQHQVYLHGFSASTKGKGHWNRAGHEAAAQSLAQELCRWLTAQKPADRRTSELDP